METGIGLEILCNLTNETLERELHDEEFNWFLVNFMKSNSFTEEMVRPSLVVAVVCVEDLAESCLWVALPPVRTMSPHTWT